MYSATKRRRTAARKSGSSFVKHEGSEILGDVVWVAVHHASRLPAQEVPLRIFTESLDPIQVCAPPGSRFHRLFADRSQRYPRRGVPDLLLLVDPRGGLPTGPPALVVAILV